MPENVFELGGIGVDREKSLSVRKAVMILRCFSHAAPELSLADIVRETKMPRTICHRIVSTLEDEGLLSRDGVTSRYRIGIGMFTLASTALAGMGIRDVASRELAALSRRTEDVTLLVVEHGREALCIDRFEGTFPIQQSALTIGKTMALHIGGSPFALLSYMPEDRREALLAMPMRSFTRKTVTEPAAIRDRIAQVRERGYAVGDEDAIEYLVAIGVPILGAGGALVGALSVGGLKQRYPESRIADVAAEAKIVGEAISLQMGMVKSPYREAASR